MPRPYFNIRVDELELLFDQCGNDEELLRGVLQELQYRTTQRAGRLRQRVESKLAAFAQVGSGSKDIDDGSSGNATTPPESNWLTEEQKSVIRAFANGRNLKVNAFAGAGKTSTLVELGRSTPKRGLYLSFNRRNADEAKARFPESVDCRTTHSLAYRAVSRQFPSAKLSTPLTSAIIHMQMDLQDVSFSFLHQENGEEQERHYRLRARQIASIVGTTVRQWLYSDYPDLGQYRIAMLGSMVHWPSVVQSEVDKHVRGLCVQCWQKMSEPSDPLPLSHDGYVKYWALSNPVLNASFVLLDEAQDTNPVILDVLQKQECQVVYVGDRHQQIYEWRGAVNAMEAIHSEDELQLSQSFRFGKAIADLANKVLRQLGETTPLRGHETVESRVGRTNAQAILARTNVSVISRFIDLVIQNKKVAIQGGTKELITLLNGLLDIQNGISSDLPELLGIESWNDLKQFTETDEGRSLAPLVSLAETHRIPKLLAMLNRACQPEDCEILLSTLHKAKGLEWDRVELLSDFAPRSQPKDQQSEMQNKEELRILYVAITRAKRELQLPEDVAEYIRTFGKPKGEPTLRDDVGVPHDSDEPSQPPKNTQLDQPGVVVFPASPVPPKFESPPPTPEEPVQEIARKVHSPSGVPQNQGCAVLLAGLFFLMTMVLITACQSAW